MKAQILDRQSVLDIAIQECGDLEGAVGISVKNDISITGPQASGTELYTGDVANKITVKNYAVKGTRPATDISKAELEALPYDGIGLMGIEIDFIVN